MYFYHLRFEIYTIAHSYSEEEGATSSKDHSAYLDLNRSTFVPEDIFESLPADTNTTVKGLDKNSSRSREEHWDYKSVNRAAPSNLIQISLPVFSTLSQSQPYRKVGLDRRVGPIDIVWFNALEKIDSVMSEDGSRKTEEATKSNAGNDSIEAPVDHTRAESSSSVNTAINSAESNNFSSALSVSRGNASPTLRSTPTKSKLTVPVGTVQTLPEFSSGNTELSYGIVHLYRDSQEIPNGEEPYLKLDTKVSNDSANGGLQNVLCVLAVPSYMSPADFVAFTAPVADAVSHYRIIRDASPNKFLVLMKFRDSEHAAEFYKQYNGRPFSSLDPEICHIVYIKSVEFKSTAIPQFAFPFFHGVEFDSSATSSDLSPVGSAAPIYEIPTCPVCLERMDSSVTGLLTISCQHTFHCHCLSKWGDNSCPVCRYSQSRDMLDEEEGVEQSVCGECGASESLWICLICGHVGCGRYQDAHAYAHYESSGHLYSLELETQRVWDYAGDGYVHRLIQNKTDGKLVELPSPNPAAQSEFQNPHDAQVSQEKLDAIGLEFSYLLTSQLDSQRMYYEAELEKIVMQVSALTAQVKNLTMEVTTLSAGKEQAERELEEYGKTVRELEQGKRMAEKKLEKANDRLNKVEKELREEKEMCNSLRANQEEYKASLSAKEREAAELQEQVRDLMFFLSTQEKIAKSELRDELQSGTVVVPSSPETSSGTGTNSPRGKRRGKR
ncbi:uncharacterized protein VTP21DRAFT_4007 [Calcarisporiella thermophila]|uniref:uncharacterized protein n=1 Tax=Calcarisporiella thermophila TaxID=911321 RepID=UPI003742C979